VSIDPAQSNSAVFQITLGQVYNEVTGMRTDIRDLAAAVRHSTAQGQDHEQRVRTLERESATSSDLEELKRDHALRLAALERVAATTEDVEKVRLEYGPRMSALERRVYIGIGIATTISVGASWLLTAAPLGH
jgi:hypothetical protein